MPDPRIINPMPKQTYIVASHLGSEFTILADDLAIGDKTAIFLEGTPPNTRIVAAFTDFSSIIRKREGTN